MKRSSLMSVGSIVLAMALVPASAVAAILELGATRTPVTAPTCPSNLPLAQCTIILARSTALETIRDGVTYPTKIHKAGRIVAFTVGLSALSADRATRKSLIHNQDLRWGGTTQVQITILRPNGPARDRNWKVVSVSPSFHVQPYLGTVVQFPLETTLAVKPGYVVALTTPTWLPVLSILQNSRKFAYRQSRKTNCSNPPAPPARSSAQVRTNQSAQYLCNYPGTRVEYSATEITQTPFPANYVHTTDVG